MQCHTTKRWTTKGVISEVRKGDDGSNTSFLVESESGRTLLRHCAHIRPDITSTDRIAEPVLKFQEQIDTKEFKPHIEMRITRSKARELSSLVLKKKSALRTKSCSPETLSPGGLMGGRQSSPPTPFPSC